MAAADTVDPKRHDLIPRIRRCVGLSRLTDHDRAGQHRQCDRNGPTSANDTDPGPAARARMLLAGFHAIRA
jgi:hypothetical protein